MYLVRSAAFIMPAKQKPRLAKKGSWSLKGDFRMERDSRSRDGGKSPRQEILSPRSCPTFPSPPPSSSSLGPERRVCPWDSMAGKNTADVVIIPARHKTTKRVAEIMRQKQLTELASKSQRASQ